MNVLYFGCWQETGHYPWLPGMIRGWEAQEQLPWKWLDGTLPPVLTRSRSGVVQEVPQGHAALHWKAGWTALAFWDRSVDKRGGSNSVFCIRGTHSFGDAVRIARDAFPQVWERLPFEVVLVREPSGERPVAIMSLEEKAADYDRLRAETGGAARFPLRVGSDGAIRLPQSAIDHLGAAPGARLYATLGANHSVRLFSEDVVQAYFTDSEGAVAEDEQ